MTDAFDRVLDKGIVFDAFDRMSRAGIELISSKVRLVVSSIHTRLDHEGPSTTTGWWVHEGAAIEHGPRAAARRGSRQK